jgi:hypothetical protein
VAQAVASERGSPHDALVAALVDASLCHFVRPAPPGAFSRSLRGFAAIKPMRRRTFRPLREIFLSSQLIKFSGQSRKHGLTLCQVFPCASLRSM